jgi:hypothetical protein
MKPYGCISTGHNNGMIKTVMNSQTLAMIQTDYGGKAAGAFSSSTMVRYLKQYNEEKLNMILV